MDIQLPYVISHPELIEVGERTIISPYARIQVYPELTGNNEYRLFIGKNCFIGYRVSILVGASIEIGDNVAIASDVSIISQNHGMNPESIVPYKEQELVVKPIKIGNNCWVGDKTVITAGVTIGDNCIIGAGSVVTKTIPSMSMAAGNPARVIKQYNKEKHEWIQVGK